MDQGKGTRLERQRPARFYAGPTFSVGSVDSKGRQVGFDYDSAGVFGGFDYAFDRFGFGVAADYTSLAADVHKHWGHFHLDQVVGSFYTVYSPSSCEELSINGVVGGGYDWYTFSRTAGPSFATQTAKGKTNGYVVDALIDFEYTVTHNLWPAMHKDCRLIPLVDLQYIHLNKDRYTETNAGVYNLTVQNESLNSLRTALGTRIDRTWKWANWSLRPQVDLAWQYEYLNQNRTVIFSALSSLSDSGVGFVPIVAARSTLLAGIDFLFTIKDFFEIELTYDLEYNKRFFDNSFYVGLGASF
jgi:outer membrane autotransporter protein